MEAASAGTFSLAVTTWKCSGGTTTFTDFLPLFCTPLKSTGMICKFMRCCSGCNLVVAA
jgi:hypothetical protein